MLMDRIVGAFTFRRGVYAEVEKDTGFTTTAWILVIVVAFLNQLGAYASGNVVGWLMGAVAGTIVTVIGFAVAAFVVQWVGRALFKADVTFEEMVRTLGLAFVWYVVGVLGILGVIPVLGCLMLPIHLAAWILWLIASLVAAKEALDLEWVQTIVTVFLGLLGSLAIWIVAQVVLRTVLGIGAAGLGLLQGAL